MALSHVNSSSNMSSTTSVAITKPTNVADGDIMIAFVTSFWATNKTAGTVTAPSGWNTINTQAISTRYQVGLFWKRASSEGASYSFTSTSATRMQGAISAYRGAVASGSPYNVLSNTLYGTSGTIVRAATMTPSSNGLYVVWGGWFYLSSATALTKPTAMTLLQTRANTTNVVTMAHSVFTPGVATGSQDGTASGTCTVKHAYMVEVLAAPDTATQTATASIQKILASTQTATANIGVSVEKNQSATARIAVEKEKTQTATAKIAQIFTAEQTATASIFVAGISTNSQYALARIQRTDSITQLATAQIQKENLVSEQTATARIQVVGNVSDQMATARILLPGVIQVILDSPDDGIAVHDATPTLYFTGSDPNNDDLEYCLQIDTVDTFDSTSGGWPLITKYSDGTVYYRSTGAYNSSSSASAVVPAPAGLVDGDLIFVSIRRSAAINPTGVPSGWNLIQSVLSTYGFWVYYKVAKNEGVSWTWSWAAATRMLAYSYAFYGDYDLNNPIQNSTTPYSAAASGTAIGIPTLTTSVDNTMSLIISSAYSTSAKTFTVPTSPAYNERSDTGSTTPDFWQAVATYVYSTANTSTGTISYPVSAASTYRIGCQILINPNIYTGFESGNPYTSGSQVTYTSSIPLASNLYYWRLRAKDPAGGNTFGDWSDFRSVTIQVGMKVRDASDWSYKPVKYWNGSQWMMKPVKVWDGNSWVLRG